jgi:hypothetical protein
VNPEDPVVDLIGELVDASLDARNQDDYNSPLQEKCPLCVREWHGLPKEICGWGDPDPFTCPGAFATEEEASEYRRGRPPSEEPATIITFPNTQGWWPLGYSR